MTTPAERAAAIAAQAHAKERAKAADNADKKKNRELMPQMTAFVDAYRDWFGPEPLPYGKGTENGRTVRWGKSPEERWTGPKK